MPINHHIFPRYGKGRIPANSHRPETIPAFLQLARHRKNICKTNIWSPYAISQLSVLPVDLANVQVVSIERRASNESDTRPFMVFLKTL